MIEIDLTAAKVTGHKGYEECISALEDSPITTATITSWYATLTVASDHPVYRCEIGCNYRCLLPASFEDYSDIGWLHSRTPVDGGHELSFVGTDNRMIERQGRGV